MNGPIKYSIAIIAVVIGTIAGTLFVRANTVTLGYDDAFISFRYAENFASGDGLVFNPGERPVEGYSNLLYVLLIAPVTNLLDRDLIYSAGIAINIAAIIGAALFMSRFPRAPGTTPWRNTAMLLTALNPLMWHAAWSAMETGLVVFGFTALWFAIVWIEDNFSVRRSILLVLAVAFCVLIRADGFILTGIAVCYLGIRGAWRGFAVGMGALAAIYGAHMAWRLSYYGFPMPNTYYAKVSGPIFERINFAWHTFKSLDVLYPAFAICAIAIGVWAAVSIMNRRNPIRLMPFEVWFVPVWIAYWFFVGGDIFRHRFLLVLIPIAAYIVAYRIAPVVDRKVVIAAIAAVFFYYPAQGHRILSDDIKHDTWIILGKHFREVFPDETLAVDAAGKMPYFADARTIDTLGLNDLHIARVVPEVFIPGHNKYDFDYVLKQNPGIIAGWMTPLTLDVGKFLPQTMYEEHGYKLAYTVYLLHGSASEGPYVDVRGMSKKEIVDLQFAGYEYAILLREDLYDRGRE